MAKNFFRICFFERFFILPLVLGSFWLFHNSCFSNLVLAEDSILEEENQTTENQEEDLSSNKENKENDDNNFEIEMNLELESEPELEQELEQELELELELEPTPTPEPEAESILEPEEIPEEKVLEEVSEFNEEEETTDKEVDKEDEKTKNEGQIFFNEVAWMGSEFSSYDEWLELYNPNDFDLSLEGWELNFWKPLENEKGEVLEFDEKIYGKPYFSVSFTEKDLISAEGFFLLAKEKYNQHLQDEVDFFYKGTLVNDGGYLELKNKEANQFDFLNAVAGWSAGDNSQKLTLEKDVDSHSWHTASRINGTPREKNSLPLEKTIEEEIFSCQDYLAGVYLNEILPNPEGKDQGQEWVEIFNDNEFEINLSGWWLVNSSGKKFFLENVFLGAGGFKKINFPNTFVVKNQKERIFLFSCQGINRSELFFIDSAPSGQSFNRNKKGVWRWGRQLTPERENLFNQIPILKIKKIKETFVNIPILFDASESWDRDGEELKFVWDFGDGRKSYLNKVSHAFSSVGKKKVLLKVNDGSEIVEKIINLEIKKYPQRKVGLVKILPNPKGTDSGKELLWIKNLDNKKVNLKTWKIFSGSSEEKATGHLINKDFFLKKGEEKSLSRKESLFSLTNQIGYVALVYPDGKKAFELNYSADKNIPEEAVYFLDQNGQWQWSFISEEEISLTDEENQNNFEENEPVSEVEVLGEKTEFSWNDFFEKLGKKKTLSWKELDFVNWQKENSQWLDFLPAVF